MGDLVVYISALFGNIWGWVNPWAASFGWAEALFLAKVAALFVERAGMGVQRRNVGVGVGEHKAALVGIGGGDAGFIINLRIEEDGSR